MYRCESSQGMERRLLLGVEKRCGKEGKGLVGNPSVIVFVGMGDWVGLCASVRGAGESHGKMYTLPGQAADNNLELQLILIAEIEGWEAVRQMRRDGGSLGTVADAVMEAKNERVP